MMHSTFQSDTRQSMDSIRLAAPVSSPIRPAPNALPLGQAFLVSDDFSMQRLSLDRAVAPLIAKPTAPFAKTERKRALLNASYYSECFLNSISPIDADTAALDAQSRYEKWWVKSKFNESEAKRRRLNSQSKDNRSRDSDERVETYITSDDEASVAIGIGQPSTLQYDRLSHLHVETLKADLVADLQATGGDTSTKIVQSCIDNLHVWYLARGLDARWITDTIPFSCDGTWLTLSKPTYSESLGRNNKGQYEYTLGRMSFDMFRPTNLRCSIQGVFNTIALVSKADGDRPRSFPKKLQKSYDATVGLPPVRSYDIEVAFTIEANQTRHGVLVTPGSPTDEFVVRKPIRGILTNHGYCVPDPETPNRLSIWFSGGSLESQEEDEASLEQWRQLFDEKKAPRRDFREFARVLAAKFLLGAHVSDVLEEDGALGYKLHRPIGGHGQVFCDILYSDGDLRIVRGHQGTIFVFRRVPG